MRITGIGLLIIVLLLAACGTPAVPTTGTSPLPTDGAAPPTSAPGSEPAGSLAGTEWQLESFGPVGQEQSAVAGSAATLKFEAGDQAGGSGGCNSFGTQYQVKDSTVTFGPVVSTKMACADNGVMQQEQLFFEALAMASEFELAGDRLAIHYDNGQGVLNFVKGP